MSEFKALGLNKADSGWRVPRASDTLATAGPFKTPGVFNFQFMIGSSQSVQGAFPETLAVNDLVEVSADSSSSVKYPSVWRCTDTDITLPVGVSANTISSSGVVYITNPYSGSYARFLRIYDVFVYSVSSIDCHRCIAGQVGKNNCATFRGCDR